MFYLYKNNNKKNTIFCWESYFIQSKSIHLIFYPVIAIILILYWGCGSSTLVAQRFTWNQVLVDDIDWWWLNTDHISLFIIMTFLRLCRLIIRPVCTVFNTVHAILDINNICKFKDISRISMRVRACTDRLTDEQIDIQANRMLKHFKTSLNSVEKKSFHLIA